MVHISYAQAVTLAIKHFGGRWQSDCIIIPTGLGGWRIRVLQAPNYRK